MRRIWPLTTLCLIWAFACDSGDYYRPSSYPVGGGGSGGGATYETHSTCGWGGNCTIEIEEVGGPALRQRRAEAALACKLNSDCREGMLCIEGSCSPQCNADRDCGEGELCMPASHGYGECQASEPRVKLSEAIALRAMKPAIEQAQACFSAEDREAKVEVRVHLTVEGAGGQVEAANLQGSWEAKPLGQCVAKAMAKSEFPPLNQTRVAFWYPVRAGVVPKVEPAPAPTAAATPAPSVASSDISKLGAEQIRAGIDTVRPQFEACFTRAGADPSSSVSVRLTVEGASGFVSRVEPLDDAEGTSLGTCVAAKLAGIEFPSFEAQTQRFTYKARGPRAE